MWEQTSVECGVQADPAEVLHAYVEAQSAAWLPFAGWPELSISIHGLDDRGVTLIGKTGWSSIQLSAYSKHGLPGL